MDHAHEERALVTRAAQGDESAFRALVREHETALARTIIAMIGPGDDADDVGQQTFVRFLRALDHYRGDASVRTYLTRIAMNLCLDLLAQRKRRVRWLRLVGNDTDPPLIAPDAAGDGTDEARRLAVRRAVDTLEPIHRAVVVLRFLEERSTRETATMLGIPEGTVMSRLKRALDQLRFSGELEDAK